ncbi:RNA polymerase II transcription factor B subunit 2 [Radiomyces spectabilis]|uniref:RNA polymerase II transcription factor B subunit 2 n=1 Tax=Radiomyces spectabilis TaxID=64574 RepID=UPI00222017C0|nr:RNA polymerase II transcription factor B subunit 2 [Radiomyces spectabilis]KAI8367654.1 RNA polymerase II transcription factor B subunit 2 [Radiomyces spectabilis]
MSVDNFKTNIYDYLQTLPTFTFMRLFEKPATCLAIFRLLPSIGRQMVMSLLYIDSPILIKDINSWVNKDGQRKLAEALHKLTRLRILKENEHDIVMNDMFRQEFRNALTGGGTQQSFGLPCTTPDKHPVDIAFLDQYANQQWEAILHYMVGTSLTKKPSRGVLNLLERSQLMQNSPDNEGQLQITNKGFQFLLQDVNTQVWAFLLQYLDMAEMLQMDLVEVLNFLFQLGSLELGENYSVETLTQTQQQMLEDLRDYGIVYQRKRGSRRYYPTRLATTLTSGNAALATKLPKTSSAVEGGKAPATDEEEGDQGFVILETNYRVYAYTESPLQIAVLNLFVHLQSRFQNMVAGLITRDSVRNALLKGITADQIISYMQTHAHPQMRKKTPILPLTVVDQIRLWEMERNRLKATPAYLYHEFNVQADFDAAEKHARDLGVLLWSNQKKRTMVITQGGHESVKGFVKRRLKGGGGDDAHR